MIATLELTTDSPIVINFDITQYLTPGVEYGHVALKQAYYAACDAGLWASRTDPHFREGTSFRLTVYAWWNLGLVEMSEAVSRYGNKTDFFDAVLVAHPEDHPEYKEVSGYLIVHGVPDEDVVIDRSLNGVIPW